MENSSHSREPNQEHEHSPYLQHHFDTPEQQFESGKLGMWLFLATEILLFGGLFCAYAVYRSNHPEIFIYAHKYLDIPLGGINTAVLIFSSLTMAWAVRASQLGQQKQLITLLAVTLFCGFIFLGIKYVEYEHKWKDGLLWGTRYDPQHHEETYEEQPSHPQDEEAMAATVNEATGNLKTSSQPEHNNISAEDQTHAATNSQTIASSTPSSATPTAATQDVSSDQNLSSGTESVTTSTEVRSQFTSAAIGPSGLAQESADQDSHTFEEEPGNVHIFFGIYFTMTGLHAIHVIVGMICIAWILFRSIKGHFGPQYYTPVDFVGLYWHLVDLIWIYLFPLLYLIH